jgi:Tol biopolymer transport system component
MKRSVSIAISVAIIAAMITGMGTCSKKGLSSPPVIDTTVKIKPALSGRLIFHSYTCYSCNDSKLFLYDFASNTLSEISTNWNIVNPMNGHFAPDGHKIVFMGMAGNTANWDIFLWKIGSTSPPVNLTSAYGNTRDEDPKFSHDGARIIFKQNGVLKEIDTTGNITRSFFVPQTEASMPYYGPGDSAILYSGSESSGATADIFIYIISSGVVTPLSNLPSVEEYYPITIDDTSFLFTRWVSSTNQNDQVYKGYFSGRQSQRLIFSEQDQNYSDAYPVNAQYIIFSSTRPGGKGEYDLYVADINSGYKWSLSLYNEAINSSKNELGACYSGN